MIVIFISPRLFIRHLKLSIHPLLADIRGGGSKTKNRFFLGIKFVTNRQTNKHTEKPKTKTNLFHLADTSWSNYLSSIYPFQPSVEVRKVAVGSMEFFV